LAVNNYIQHEALPPRNAGNPRPNTMPMSPSNCKKTLFQNSVRKSNKYGSKIIAKCKNDTP
jgi:hypothetical protein